MNPGLSVPVEGTIELRTAVRFPLRIPIVISTELGELAAVTENISANGILFEVGVPLKVGSTVGFRITMPAEAMGTPAEVVVNCTGRVVRCTPSSHGAHAAAMIDKYYFSH